MAELFLELFSEEIPARMQRGAAAELGRLVGRGLARDRPGNVATWFGPRRIALRGRRRHRGREVRRPNAGRG